METTKIDKDISVFCVTAVSFPDGVMAAHKRIHELAPMAEGRIYFGISRPEKGVITYMAGANEL
ncbi:MAG: putative transcription activator, partial [Flavipsychrobacter sp.]|nr:putative transcription activator [Flavipsychrobacter sp.]